MFVLLFAFVFGGAIPLPGGGTYKEFLMPGIFAQTSAFASATTGVGITDDMSKGLIDRFRSLPMVRSAFLTGRTFADVVYNAGILVVLMVPASRSAGGSATGSLAFLAAVGIAAALRVRDELARRLLGQLGADRGGRPSRSRSWSIFPITFVSNAFVPRRRCPVAAAGRRVEPGEHADRVACASCSATRTRSTGPASRPSTRS